MINYVRKKKREIMSKPKAETLKLILAKRNDVPLKCDKQNNNNQKQSKQQKKSNKLLERNRTENKISITKVAEVRALQRNGIFSASFWSISFGKPYVLVEMTLCHIKYSYTHFMLMVYGTLRKYTECANWWLIAVVVGGILNMATVNLKLVNC